MKNNERKISLDAQVFIDLCEKNGIHSCAVVTSLKKEKVVRKFLENFCAELNHLGQKTVWTDCGEKEMNSDAFRLCCAPHPHRVCEDYNACKNCDTVLLIEKYGDTRHDRFDEMIAFLKEHGISYLGVIALKN